MQTHKSPQKYVLIAEDDRFIASAYKVKLEKEGFLVRIGIDGDQTLEFARKTKPDLLILDLVMPVKDGFVVLEELKKDIYLKDIPVVVLSNLGQEEDIKRALQLGASSYLVKTDTTIDTMVSKVKEYLT